MSEERLARVEQKLDYLIVMLETYFKVVNEMDENKTLEIVTVMRSVTKNSSSPMWRCFGSTGEQVNVFLHRDVDKNNFHLIENAGYGDYFLEMKDESTVNWQNCPIRVAVRRNGKWLELAQVEHKPESDKPDPNPIDAIKQQFDDAGF